MSTLTDIADAVTAELNAETWSQSFTAVRMNVPRHKRDEMQNMLVTVAPKSRTTTRATRGQSYKNIEVFVGIEKGLTLESDLNTESDPLIQLGEDIAEYFENGRSLATYPGAPCVSVKFGSGDEAPWLNAKEENEYVLYSGIIVLEFQLLTP